jgi:aspartate ammonia-lyase
MRRRLRREVRGHLAKITGFPIHLAEDLIEATQDTQAFVLYSSCLKSLAIKLAKVGNDLRLLSSARAAVCTRSTCRPSSRVFHHAGQGESRHPGSHQHGVVPVIGNDFVVTMSAEAGQLQLNAFEPVIAAVVFEGQTLLINAARTLRKHCVEGITANPNILKRYVENSIGTVTALNPVIGYERSTELAAEAMKTGQGIVELVREQAHPDRPADQ